MEEADMTHRPTLDVSPPDLEELVETLAASRTERRRFLRDPPGYLRDRRVSVDGGRVAAAPPRPPTSEVCTANAICNVNSAVNVNAATKVNAVSAVNAAITANASAFVNVIAAYQVLVFNRVQFWGEPAQLEVRFMAGYSLGSPDQVV
jgi:hypothetical protein